MGLKLAERWFEYRALDDGITHIWEPHVTPLCRCNIWHVRGRDRDLLIDSGLGVSSLVDAIGLLVEKRTLAAATHTHFDHMGSHHEFDQRAVHASEAEIMANPTRANTLAEGYVDDQMLTAMPHDDYDPGRYTVTPAPPTQLLAEGNVIDLGDRVLDVLHLPGHTVGSIGFWEQATGTLFSGDAVYDGLLFDDLINSNVDDYIETMWRLREFPARVVHGGHYRSFDRERLLELIDDYIEGKRASGCPVDLLRKRRR